jgi:hypothetical protein
LVYTRSRLRSLHGFRPEIYVIGGYGWKARWLDADGYIITGDTVQWNLATEEFSAYHASDPIGTKPYDCGKSHTTCWTPTDENGLHQYDLPGIHGTFSEGGVTCEACHGPGSELAAAPSASNIIRDNSPELRVAECVL